MANIAVGSSLQSLWELVHAQQIVVLLPLSDTIIPPNCQLVFDKLMEIAAFDAIPTDDIYETISDVEG